MTRTLALTFIAAILTSAAISPAAADWRGRGWGHYGGYHGGYHHRWHRGYGYGWGGPGFAFGLGLGTLALLW